jgi:class 3 adenylate cyclase/TolB-like protein
MERRLSAFLAADVVGYSRLMERDEADTFERLRAHRRQLFTPEIEKHHGRIFKLMGDGLLAEFASVVDAVECAVALQRGMAERNAGLPENQRIAVRIGINLGDVIVEGEDRHGEGVNIAARLQQLADLGGIAVSRTVVNHVNHKVAFGFESQGEHKVKNIAEPIGVYRVLMDPAAAMAGPGRWRLRPWSAGLGLAPSPSAGRLGPQKYQLTPTPRRSTSAEAAATAAPAAGEVVAAGRGEPAVEIRPASVQDEGIPVIVVLPFQDLTGDRTESDLGKGIAEQFITDLASFPDYEVVSSSTSFAYAGRPVPDIVKATSAVFVIEGSIRRSGDKAVVTMQLIRGSTDRHLMIAQVEQELKDPVIFQSAVVGKLRDQLGGMTGVLRRELVKIALAKAPADLTEYDYYIIGHVRLLRAEGEAARDIWMKGLTHFPDSTLLRFNLMAYCYYFKRQPALAGELMAEAAKFERRTQLDEWYFHWLLAELYSRRGEFQRAVLEAKAAVAMAPYDTTIHGRMAPIVMRGGLADEAIEWAKFTVTNDPHPQAWYFLGLYWAYRDSGRLNEAVKLAETQVARDPTSSKWWYDFLASPTWPPANTKKLKRPGRRLGACLNRPSSRGISLSYSRE